MVHLEEFKSTSPATAAGCPELPERLFEEPDTWVANRSDSWVKRTLLFPTGSGKGGSRTQSKSWPGPRSI